MSAASNYLEDELVKAIFRTTTWVQRANSTVYSLGDRVYAATFDGNVYECITAGTSAAAPPTFNTNLGDSTTDGTVTWLTLKLGLPKRPLYVALYTAAPGETGGGTEVTGGSYARVAIAPADANWAATSGGNGLTSNVADATYPAPTAAWGTVTHMSVLDRLTVGNFLVYGALTTSRIINSGDAAPKFAATALTVTVA